MSAFTDKQVEQLLKPINPRRVLQAQGHSHVSQQDITAHLIRMFGFGGFDTEVLSAECIFEDARVNDKGEPTGRYDVCYRALLRLTIRDADGKVVCQYEDGSTATAQNHNRGDGHDLAYKSAISLAKKRAAINLGDQFGLSLYNRGQVEALVMQTLVGVDADAPADVQDGVAQQVSLGNDEIDYEPAAEPPDPELANEFLAAIETATTPAELEKAGAELAKSTVPSAARELLRAKYTAKMQTLLSEAA